MPITVSLGLQGTIMKSRYVKSLAVAAWAAWGIVPGTAQAQLVDLGATTGYALNNSGEAALGSGIYANGAVTPLPSLPGSTTPATPLAITASGQVAGSDAGVPIEYSGGILTNLLPSSYVGPDGSDGGPATGINSDGTIVGWIDLFTTEGPGASTIGFSYSNGVFTTLAIPSGCESTQYFNQPAAINDSGQITGTSECLGADGYGVNIAYLLNNGVSANLGYGAGYAINASGEVTGNLQVFSANGDISGTYTFLYSNGTTTNLGKLPGGRNSTGYAINITGQIVGSSDFPGSTASSTATHGFFYNGVMTDLNSLVNSTDPLRSVVTLASGVAINDSRLILANGVDSRTGVTHAYLLQAPWINVGPAALTFAAVVVGATSPAQSVTVSNSGASAIALGTIIASTNFSIASNTCTASLAPGAQCTVAVASAPATAGATTGTLTVPSVGVNYSIALNGTGTGTASIVASAKTATVGQPLTLTWTASPGLDCGAMASSTNTMWIPGKPPFTGNLPVRVPVSGKQTLTETVDGTMTYTLACSVPGPTPNGVSVSASVVWSWAPVNATISASPTSITAGEAVTVTWSSSNATSCSATGGGESDGWPGSKATSGNQTVTESFAPATGTATVVYTITCTSSTSGLTSHASAQVVESKPPSNSGGGGGFDLLSLAGLTGLLALRLKRAQSRVCCGRGID
jgi:probable HAF family extracellular repeat protein